MTTTLTADSKSAPAEVLNSALREAVWKQHAKVLLKEDQHDFFFVDVGEDGPSWNARRLSDDFKGLFAKSHRPRYRTLLNISQGLPVALPNLVKLHACVKSYCSHGSAKYSGALEQDGWQDGLPQNSVVPCLYILDRKRSTSFAKDKNGVPELPKRVFDYIMKDVEDGELGEYLGKKCGSSDGLEVEHSMRNNCIDGTNTREIRVTSKIARGVVDFLNTKNKSEKVLEVKHVFVWGPARGEGKGRRTSALPLTAGNVLPSIEEAVDYPTF